MVVKIPVHQKVVEIFLGVIDMLGYTSGNKLRAVLVKKSSPATYLDDLFLRPAKAHNSFTG